MRALVLIALLLGCGGGTKPAATARTSDVRVDRRVELVSIVCALAGFKEYTLGKVNPYRTEVVAAFRPFLGHPAVAMAKALRAEHGIGYDAPMIFAVHLDDQLHLVNAAELAALDARWQGVDAEAYAAALRDFAAASHLDAFLDAHRAHYAQLEDTLRGAVDAEHPIEWFDGVFGPRTHARYTVVPSPMTGTYNFGVRATLPDGTLQMYQLIGVDTASGLVEVNDDLVYLLVHEMAHSYINPVLAAHADALAAPAAALFAKVAGQMRAQAYPTWQIFLNEAVVRATTLVYFGDKKGDATTAALLDQELARGFLWTAELAGVMRAYQHDHEDYVPKLAARLAELAR